MTEAEKYYKEKTKYIDNVNGYRIVELMQSFADEQVKKKLRSFLSWRNKRYGTPNPNPQLDDLDVYNFLNEKL